MFMKKIIILLTATVLSFVAKAQFSFGPKAGVNIAKEKYGDTFYSTTSHSFFCAGVFANYALKKQFAAQLELVYSGEGTNESYTSGPSNVTGVVTINRINIPLLFQYKTPVGVYFETGPQIGLLLSAKGEYKYTNPNSTKNYDFKSNTQSALFSWCFGAGYQLNQLIPGLGINARYAAGLGNSNKGNVAANSIKSNVISIALFWAIPCSGKTKTQKH